MTDQPSPYSLESLAADQDFSAVAAVCFHMATLPDAQSRGRNTQQAKRATEAMKALIKGAETVPHAFVQAWRLMHSDVAGDGWWELWTASPAALAVPEELHDEVAAWFSQRDDGQQVPASGHQLRERLLDSHSLPDRRCRAVAAAVIETEPLDDAGVVLTAARVLASGNKADREPCLRLAESVADKKLKHQLLKILGTASRGFRRSEAERVVAMLAADWSSSADSASLPVILGGLPTDHLSSFLNSEAIAAQPAILQSLAIEKSWPIMHAQALLDGGLTPEVRAALLERFSRLSGDDAVDWATWLQNHHPDDAKALVAKLADEAKQQQAAGGRRGRAQPPSPVIEHLAVTSESPAAGHAFAELWEPDRVLEGVEQSDVTAGQAGRILGRLLSLDASQADESLRLIRTSSNFAEAIEATLNELTADAHAELRLTLARAALDTPAAIVRVAASPGRNALGQALAELEPTAQLEALIRLAEGDDQAVIDFMPDFTWNVIDDELWAKFVPFLEPHPEDLKAWLLQAAEAAHGPESEMPTAPQLVVLLHSAVDAELWSHTDGLEEAVRLTIDHATPEVRAEASRLAANLPPSHELVEMLRQARTKSSSSHRHYFDDALQSLAQELTRSALDTSADTDTRVAALASCTKADPETAKEPSLVIVRNRALPQPLRSQAARALLEAPISLELAESLRRLADEEADAEIQRHLNAAALRAHGKDLTEALQSLTEQLSLEVELPPEPVLAPNEASRKTLQEATNQLLGAIGGQPSNVTMKAAILVDELAEIALAARFEANADAGVSEKDFRLDDGHWRLKSDIGDVLARQNVQRVFGWFSDAQTIHGQRYAHARNKRGVAPKTVVARDAETSLHLLRGVLPAWIDSMIETAGQRERSTA